MKTLRKLIVAVVFVFALAIPAFAGEIQIGIAPTPSLAGEMDTGVAGQMDTTSSEAATADSATEIALNLIQSVLALF